ncbi:MAG: FAD-dependent oxidoreductase [Patescibacteria group bacterium]
MNNYDVIVVGGSCAGLTSAIYANRRAMKVLVLAKDFGGQMALTMDIENYPGFKNISGPELTEKMVEQVKSLGVEVKMQEVTKIEKMEKGFQVTAGAEIFESKAVVLAFGLAHRHLNLPNEKELTGRGITYCATCDGPLFKNKIVAVVGGGNSAFDAVLYLSGICEKVYLLNRSNNFRAENYLIDSVKSKSNVEIKTDVGIKEIIGTNKLEKVILNNDEEINLNGLFVEIGYVPKTDFIKDFVELDKFGQIIVDEENKTSTIGVFAAGDVTNEKCKQMVVAAGAGAKAGLSVAKFVHGGK